MNYIYDIYLNLNQKLYDFFDWNKSDKLIHIKKMPIIKINKNTFDCITSNKVRLKKEILAKIYNKTELWNTNKTIPYCSLFTDSLSIIAVEFDSNGNSTKKSQLSIEEELEILEIIARQKEISIDIETLNKENVMLKTRKQFNDEKFINNELKTMNRQKLNYIYFECFGKHEKNKNIILKEIKSIKANSAIYKNLYDILKLTSTSKNK